MLDSLSVPRRPYDFEDYVSILRRNLRWLIAPAFAGLVIATVVAYSLTDTYVSTAKIRITPQQINPEFMQNFTSQDASEKFNGMAETILSRNTLSNLIDSYGLYKKEVKSGEPRQDIVDKMHKAISIQGVGGSNMGTKFLPVIQIGFAYSDKYTAQKICADLVSRFTNLSVQDVLQSQTEAGIFVENEAQQAKRDLDQIEQKLAKYQEEHAGRLPEEMQTNLQQMNALSTQLGSLMEEDNRNSERRMMLENELRIARDGFSFIHSPQAQYQNEKLAGLDKDIQTQENNIAAMRDRYTDDYPEMQAAKDRLAFLKKQRDEAAKEKAPKVDTTAENPNVTRERLDASAQIDRIQTQLKANAMEANDIHRNIASINGSLRAYQSRVEGVPSGEKEYSDLLRDRDLAKQRYLNLEDKREKANISIDMERNKQGENLELLDSASLPTSPSLPKRGSIFGIGAVAGLALGILLVAIREVKDTSLKSLKDARLYTQLSILGSIPLLENDIVVQRRKQVMWVGWATATLAGLVVMAGTMAHYYLTRG